MTASERRGRRLFLILATLTVMVKLGSIFLGIFGHVGWFGGVFSLILALSMPLLWRGTVWLQRLVGLTYVFSGTRSLIHWGRSLVDYDVLGFSLAFDGILSLVDVLAGLAFLFLPDLVAFFRYRRETKGLETSPGGRRLKAAAGWGLALGAGSGLLLAAQELRSMSISLQEVGVSFLTGLGAGGSLGLVAGLAVGAAGPGVGLMTTRRYVVTRGLIAAGACVVTEVVGVAIYGGLFGQASSDFPADPGWPRAGMWAVMWLFLASPMLAAAGFVLGVPIALLLREPGQIVADFPHVAGSLLPHGDERPE